MAVGMGVAVAVGVAVGVIASELHTMRCVLYITHYTQPSTHRALHYASFPPHHVSPPGVSTFLGQPLPREVHAPCELPPHHRVERFRRFYSC